MASKTSFNNIEVTGSPEQLRSFGNLCCNISNLLLASSAFFEENILKTNFCGSVFLLTVRYYATIYSKVFELAPSK